MKYERRLRLGSAGHNAGETLKSRGSIYPAAAARPECSALLAVIA